MRRARGRERGLMPSMPSARRGECVETRRARATTSQSPRRLGVERSRARTERLTRAVCSTSSMHADVRVRKQFGVRTTRTVLVGRSVDFDTKHVRSRRDTQRTVALDPMFFFCSDKRRPPRPHSRSRARSAGGSVARGEGIGIARSVRARGGGGIGDRARRGSTKGAASRKIDSERARWGSARAYARARPRRGRRARRTTEASSRPRAAPGAGRTRRRS